MFAIEVEYLAGKVVATDTADRTVVEWPPHPQRLFSTLVAAAEESGLSEDADLALRWLEQQSAPSLVADLKPSLRSPHGHFVPVNDQIATAGKVKKGQERLDPLSLRGTSSRQERFFPCCIPNPATCHFLWPEVQPPEDVKGALSRILNEVTYLGHSSSPIRAALSEPKSKVTFEPATDGDDVLRVPGPGRLERLRHIHQARLANEGIQPPIGRTQRYRRMGARAAQGPLTLHTVLKIIEGPRPDLILGLEPIASVLRRLRQAILSHCSIMDELIHGHTPDGSPTANPHMALVPLANIGHEYADGSVKGFAVLLPRVAHDELKNALTMALYKLNELKLGKMGSLNLLPLVDTGNELHSLRFNNRYVRGSKIWTTVTPMILDRWPKKHMPIEAVIAASAERFGLPRPERVEVTRAGILNGVPSTSQFTDQMPDGTPIKQVKGRPLWHVRLSFAARVEGPIVLGAGRFVGMGLFQGSVRYE